MSLKTLVMASIYEFCGHNEQALQIYKDLSAQGSVEAELGVERLSNLKDNLDSQNLHCQADGKCLADSQANYKNKADSKRADSKWLEVFSRIKNKEQARIFKEWLGKWS